MDGSSVRGGASSPFDAAEVAGVALAAITGAAHEEGDATDRATDLAGRSQLRPQGLPSATCGRFLDTDEEVDDGHRARAHVTGGLELLLQAPLLLTHELRGEEARVEKRAVVAGWARVLVAINR